MSSMSRVAKLASIVAGLTLLAGCSGSKGADGAVGPTGATGATGAAGANGATGATGPAGPTLIKRVNFSFVYPDVAGANVIQAATISFTPPTSGTAYLRGRGYCNLSHTTGQSHGVNLAAGTVLANLFVANVPEWGVVSVPSGAPTGNYQIGWTSESTIAVTAGTATTTVLGVRHETGTNITDNCTGSFSAQVYTGTLP